MKKAIGWFLIICGILALIGGFTSSNHNLSSVVIMGYILKFFMIIGGFKLISPTVNSKIEENKKNNQSESFANNYANETLNTSNFNTAQIETASKQYSFLVREVDGFYQLEQDVVKSNEPNSFKNISNEMSANPNKAISKRKLTIINDFYIKDDISAFKMFVNDEYYSNRYESEALFKFVSPNLKKLVDEPLNKSPVYPKWFYVAYPDVAMWAIKGAGNKIVKDSLGSKLSYLSTITESDLLTEMMNTDFFENDELENDNLKIKNEHLREIIELYKKNNLTIQLECIAEKPAGNMSDVLKVNQKEDVKTATSKPTDRTGTSSKGISGLYQQELEYYKKQLDEIKEDKIYKNAINCLGKENIWALQALFKLKEKFPSNVEPTLRILEALIYLNDFKLATIFYNDILPYQDKKSLPYFEVLITKMNQMKSERLQNPYLSFYGKYEGTLASENGKISLNAFIYDMDATYSKVIIDLGEDFLDAVISSNGNVIIDTKPEYDQDDEYNEDVPDKITGTGNIKEENIRLLFNKYYSLSEDIEQFEFTGRKIANYFHALQNKDIL